MVLNIALIVFIVLETSNVAILYFAPSSRLGNGVAVFNQWEKLQKDPASASFVRYLVNWVAGTKLIFILLIAVILAMGDEPLKFAAAGAMVVSIASYYLGLHPLIKKLDDMGEITPRGYSKILFGMITGFIAMFAAAIVIEALL